jgi:hypothetical protein
VPRNRDTPDRVYHPRPAHQRRRFSRQPPRPQGHCAGAGQCRAPGKSQALYELPTPRPRPALHARPARTPPDALAAAALGRDRAVAPARTPTASSASSASASSLKAPRPRPSHRACAWPSACIWDLDASGPVSPRARVPRHQPAARPQRPHLSSLLTVIASISACCCCIAGRAAVVFTSPLPRPFVRLVGRLLHIISWIRIVTRTVPSRQAYQLRA